MTDGIQERIKCDICGKSFYSRKQLEQHTKDTHSTVDKKGMKPFKLLSRSLSSSITN